MYIKQVNHHEYDIFVGKGWNNWCRVKVVRGKDQIAAEPIHWAETVKDELDSICKSVEKKMYSFWKRK